MSDSPVDMTYIGRALERLISDVAGLKDDVAVLTAITMRLDGSHTALLTEIRATHAQVNRLGSRIRALETP